MQAVSIRMRTVRTMAVSGVMGETSDLPNRAFRQGLLFMTLAHKTYDGIIAQPDGFSPDILCSDNVSLTCRTLLR